MFNDKEDLSFSNINKLFVPLTSAKAVIIIIITGIIVFANTFFNGFVAGDIPQIVNNPVIQSINNINVFFRGSSFYNGGILTGVWYNLYRTGLLIQACYT